MHGTHAVNCSILYRLHPRLPHQPLSLWSPLSGPRVVGGAEFPGQAACGLQGLGRGGLQRDGKGVATHRRFRLFSQVPPEERRHFRGLCPVSLPIDGVPREATVAMSQAGCPSSQGTCIASGLLLRLSIPIGQFPGPRGMALPAYPPRHSRAQTSARWPAALPVAWQRGACWTGDGGGDQASFKLPRNQDPW